MGHDLRRAFDRLAAGATGFGVGGLQGATAASVSSVHAEAEELLSDIKG